MLLMALMVPWTAKGQNTLLEESFENISLGYAYSANNWYAYKTTDRNWDITSLYAHSGSKSAYCQCIAQANSYLVSAPFSVTANFKELDVSLYERVKYNNDFEEFEVFFVKASDVTNAAAVASATKYMAIAETFYSNTTFSEITGSNNNSDLAGQNVRLVVHYNTRQDGNYLYIDDITVTESMCKKPDTFEASGVTNNFATLTWSGGSGTYNIEVKGGDYADWTEILHETNLTTMNLEDLTMATEYQARIQSVSTDGNSNWKKTSFTTECGSISVGYKCGFEAPYPYTCWSKPDGTLTNYPGLVLNYYPHSGIYCLYFEGQAYYTPYQIAVLPEVDDGVNGKRLTLYACNPSEYDNASFVVGYMTAPDDASTFTQVGNTINLPAPTPYGSEPYAIDFADIEGNPHYIAIKSLSTSSSSKFTIDDVELQYTPCPAPTNVQIDETTLTHTTADLTWTGYSDSYKVQKKTATCPGTIYLNEGFENDGEWPAGWDNSVTSNDVCKWLVGKGSGFAYVNGYDDGGVTTAATGSYNALYYTSYDGRSETAWLITPKMNLTDMTDVKLSFNYCNPEWGGGLYELKVNYRVDGGEWQLLETYNTDQSSWKLETITLSGMAAKYQIGFSITGYENNYGYGVGIDDVMVYSEWADVATNVTEESCQLTDLTAGTTYDVRVKGNCNNDYSVVTTFTTIDNSIKIFTTAGEWNVTDNWSGGIPTAANDVIIRANVTIPSVCVATANNITFEGTPTLTIADEGQLYSGNAVDAIVQKDIEAATEGSDENWYLLSSPIGTVNTSDVTNLLGSGDHKYNLYNFNESTSEWNGNGYNGGFTDLTMGIGYLYRNNDGENLTYTGITKIGDISGISLTKDGTGSLSGFNLIGNPYPHNITSKYLTLTDDATFTGCYTLKTDGTWISGLETEIRPGEGFFVQIDKATTATFHETDQTVSKNNQDYIQFMVSNSEYEDVTFALFDKGNGLNKINHRNTLVPMVFIPQDGKNYAIANMSDNTEAFNLNFKAATTGQYTLKYNSKGEFSYLHVIDRITGTDVDMLLIGEYSFIASPHDNVARFIVKLGYKPNYNIEDSDIFAYQDGSDIVVTGEGELQIFDVMGRLVMKHHIDGIETFSETSLRTGVYIFRLNEKIQKIVVR